MINADNTVVWNYRPLLFGALNAPQGISQASNGNIFIADTGNNRVLEVSQSLKVENTIRATFKHPLSAEREEAVHTTLVADSGNDRVLEVDDSGNTVWGLGAPTLSHPSDARRLPNGDTLITDSGNHRVLQINRAQGLRFMYGGDGNRATCYFPNSAQGLPNGDVLIADTGNNRVIEVNQQGTIVWQLQNLESPSFAQRL